MVMTEKEGSNHLERDQSGLSPGIAATQETERAVETGSRP